MGAPHIPRLWGMRVGAPGRSEVMDWDCTPPAERSQCERFTVGYGVQGRGSDDAAALLVGVSLRLRDVHCRAPAVQPAARPGVRACRAEAFRDRVAGAVFSRSLAFFVRGYFRALFLYRVREVSGLQRARNAGPVIFVANHRGRLDGFFVLSYTGSTAVVMKSSYTRLPLFSTFARFLDFVSVDRSSLQELNRTMQRCREVLGKGKSLLVFPEGTRAPGARLLPFKDFAFRLSHAADLPIVPVVVHTSVPVLGKRYNRLAPPRRFALALRFLEPVRCAPGERPADFAERVRRAMAAQLQELDSGTDWERLPRGR
ncbi:MAG: hypothetical protein GF331_26810 [Chitinivibrionales bacterium]|nr:hypothetical protein [Chitinivibrionales bacterium]